MSSNVLRDGRDEDHSLKSSFLRSRKNYDLDLELRQLFAVEGKLEIRTQSRQKSMSVMSPRMERKQNIKTRETRQHSDSLFGGDSKTQYNKNGAIAVVSAQQSTT